VEVRIWSVVSSDGRFCLMARLLPKRRVAAGRALMAPDAALAWDDWVWDDASQLRSLGALSVLRGAEGANQPSKETVDREKHTYTRGSAVCDVCT
jgi:hypothetical protein